ncbi:LysR family transcriptional regulator [Mesorhizobium sp. L-8-10]|nr:LysR family transcriptional regulator [Mesorhizobium sp. L-8-10]
MALMRTTLVYFDFAARFGSIRKAADVLHVASSAVNRQLLLLEEEMGVPLFERLPRGIKPTAAGEILLANVRRWNREAMLLKQEIGSLRDGVRGTIRIAAAETFTEDVLPRAMTKLQSHFPHVDYTLISGDNHRITSELLAKEADVVLAYDVSEKIKAEVVHTVVEPIGIIATPDHPLSGRTVLTLAECARYPLIAPGRDWLTNSGLNVLFQGDHALGRIVAYAERPGILKALVRAGLGIAFLSSLGVEKEVSEGKLVWIPLEKSVIEPARITMLVPKGRVLPGYLSAFVDVLKDEFMDYVRVNTRSLSAQVARPKRSTS